MPKGVYQHKKGRRWKTPPMLGRHWKWSSEEARKRLSEINKEKKLSEETKRKISERNKGKHSSKETGRKISLALKGRKLSEEHKRKLSLSHKGKPSSKGMLGKHHSLETRIKKSRMWQCEKNPNWKGGISPTSNKIRGSLEYKLWEDSVLSRDSYRCQKCNENRISRLTVHHIKNFSQYPELRFAIDNGITFCRDCHKKFHKIYGKKDNTKEQIKQFLDL